jgi:uncharacterized FlaG/YvyC family protein
MEENMATEISSPLFASAIASQPVFHPAVEPRRPVSQKPQPTGADPVQDVGHLTPKELEYAVGQMNQLAKVMNHKLSFSLDYETHDIIVKVVDADTDKVIRELPAAELQKLHKSIKEALGLLINKTI